MIAMFDSGLGGLSIWRAVAEALPGWPITYLADQAYAPYGSRSRAEITRRTLLAGNYLERQGAKLLVVACNTATTVAVKALRRELGIPVVGVEPAIKPAAAASRNGRIGVLATPATLASERVRSLIELHADGVEVLSQPGTGWVERVEAGDLDSPHTRKLVSEALAPLLRERVDHIVLGCTHYPFLEPLIRELAGDSVTLDNPARAIARRVVSLLGAAPAPRSGASYRFITTSADAADMAARLPAMIGAAYPVESHSLDVPLRPPLVHRL
jgi:glutamate racemase